MDSYLSELRTKREILDKLLAHYNDGRRKTLYCAAVYLLPLEDLQTAMAELESRQGLSLKARAAAASEHLQAAADSQGISLNLNKKK